MTTTAHPGRVITDREIDAVELQVTLDRIDGRPTLQLVIDLANTRLDRTGPAKGKAI